MIGEFVEMDEKKWAALDTQPSNDTNGVRNMSRVKLEDQLMDKHESGKINSSLISIQCLLFLHLSVIGITGSFH